MNKSMKLKDFFPKIFNKEKIKKEKEKRKKIIMVLAIFFIIVLLGLLFTLPIAAYQYLNKDKVYKGIYIDGINLGGLTYGQTLDRLNQSIDNIKANGLNFYFKNKRVKIEMNIVSPTDPDLSYELLYFDTEAMAKQAFLYGRDQDFFINLQNQFKAILSQHEVGLSYRLRDSELKDVLKQNFKDMENPGQDAQIAFNQDGSFTITKEVPGNVIDFDLAINDLKNKINLLSINSIELKMISVVPQVTQIEAQSLTPKIEEVLKQDKIVLNYKDKKWEIKSEEFKNWLGFKKDNEVVKLSFRDDLLNQKLQGISTEINVPAQDAKFTMADNKVTEFVPSQNGLEVDLDNSRAKINEEFFQNNKTDIDILVKESEPAIKTGDVNNLGIKELIGVGVSDFSGSHVNRIKNIKNAVAHLNGIIIPPGEFSLVDAIGPVNATTGYFPEFVIKGDRTIPEYGGGLCQIGTTTFRVALYSGLPITERRPHSYIVSYYKPIGMDATIYGPHPDLKFNNDTGYNILLRIRIEDTKLTFEFWGTSDGRKVEITDPVL